MAEAKFGVGPVVDNGFYYDLDLGDKKLSEENFKDIEAEMNESLNLTNFWSTRNVYRSSNRLAKQNEQPYK